MLASIEGRRDDLRPSVAEDIAKRRRTELDEINGVVVEKGRDLGIETAANAGLVAAVKRIERGELPTSLDDVIGI